MGMVFRFSKTGLLDCGAPPLLVTAVVSLAMLIVRPARRTAVLLVVALLVVVATTGRLLAASGRQATGIQLVLSPHPDDELLAWPAIEDDPSTYTVVVALTRGESTKNCADAARSTQLEAGEVMPSPIPAAGDNAACGRARVEAWSAFLRRASAHTAEIRLGSSVRTIRTDDRWGGDADFEVGANSAQVVFSLPDGGLDETEIVVAIEALLASRGDTLPDLPLRRIVSASYWNDSDEHGVRTADSGDCPTTEDCPGTPTAFEYEHRDHRSLALATVTLAPLAEAGAWINVPPDSESNLRRALRSDTGTIRTMSMSSGDYEAMMGLGPDGDQGPQRLGLQQQLYGWLAFPGDWWPTGEVVNANVLFARQQTYLVIPGGGS